MPFCSSSLRQSVYRLALGNLAAALASRFSSMSQMATTLWPADVACLSDQPLPPTPTQAMFQLIARRRGAPQSRLPQCRAKRCDETGSGDLSDERTTRRTLQHGASPILDEVSGVEFSSNPALTPQPNRLESAAIRWGILCETLPDQLPFTIFDVRFSTRFSIIHAVNVTDAVIL